MRRVKLIFPASICLRWTEIITYLNWGRTSSLFKTKNDSQPFKKSVKFGLGYRDRFCGDFCLSIEYLKKKTTCSFQLVTYACKATTFEQNWFCCSWQRFFRFLRTFTLKWCKIIKKKTKTRNIKATDWSPLWQGNGHILLGWSTYVSDTHPPFSLVYPLPQSLLTKMLRRLSIAIGSRFLKSINIIRTKQHNVVMETSHLITMFSSKFNPFSRYMDTR